jgi:outer membrane protein TolC
VAEARLRLEIARQYPDLRLGPSFSQETGERKTVLGLPLGIELPLFDRNQQGITAARQHREEVRAKYEAAANRALAVLDRTYWNLQLAQEKWNLVREVFLPGAEANIRLARKLHEAGALDSLRLLETERSQRAVLVEVSDAELSVRKAWVDLEQAVGIPLFPFPGEKREAFPLLGKEQTP